MDKLQWIFELVERVSGPAKKATEATEGFDKELKKVESQIDRIKKNPLEFKKLQQAKRELRELTGGSKSFAQRFEEMGAAIKRVGFVQNLMLAGEAMKLAFEFGEKVVDVVFDVGRDLVNAAGGAERFKVAFTSLLGEQAGAGVLDYIDKITEATEATDNELKAMSAHLLTVGFDAKELSQVLPAALDIAGFLGGGVDKAQAAAEALAHIKTTGEISARSIGALGLQYTEVMKKLKAETGLGEEQLKKQLGNRKLGPQVLHAVLQSIADKEGGKLGTTAEKMADTVVSKLKKLRNVPDQIFQQWAESPGFKVFSEALGKLLTKLDPKGPNGKKIFGAIDRIAGGLVSMLDKLVSGDAIDRFIGAVTNVDNVLLGVRKTLDVIVTVSEVIATIWAGSKIVGAFTSLAGLLPGIGTAAGSLVGVLGAMAAPLAAIGAAVGAIVIAYQQISKTVDELGGWDRVSKDFKDWIGGEKPAIATDKVNENSPSWKRARAVAGADIPAASSSMRARAVAGADIPAASSSMRGGGGGARVSQNASIEPGAIVINVPPGADADEISDAVGQALPGAMQQGFERMAISSGAM